MLSTIQMQIFSKYSVSIKLSAYLKNSFECESKTEIIITNLRSEINYFIHLLFWLLITCRFNAWKSFRMQKAEEEAKQKQITLAF